MWLSVTAVNIAIRAAFYPPIDHLPSLYAVLRSTRTRLAEHMLWPDRLMEGREDAKVLAGSAYSSFLLLPPDVERRDCESDDIRVRLIYQCSCSNFFV